MTSLRLATTLALATLGGCFWTTTKSEGKAMRQDIAALETRVETKEGELQSKIAELQTALDAASKLLTRNSADLGADVAAMRDELRVANGLAASAAAESTALRESLAKLETRLIALEAKAAPAAASSAEALWAEGKLAFENARYADARTAFGKLVATYPASDRADDAQYFSGEASFKEAKHEDAIRDYQKVWEKFPTSSLADDAMFRAAEAATALKNCTEARAYYGLLRQRFSTSTLIKKADENDKVLATAVSKKDKTKCTS